MNKIGNPRPPPPWSQPTPMSHNSNKLEFTQLDDDAFTPVTAFHAN